VIALCYLIPFVSVHWFAVCKSRCKGEVVFESPLMCMIRPRHLALVLMLSQLDHFGVNSCVSAWHAWSLVARCLDM